MPFRTYHSTHRTSLPMFTSGIVIGIENELAKKPAIEAIDTYYETVKLIAAEYNLIVEEDGSLAPADGEFITHQMLYNELTIAKYCTAIKNVSEYMYAPQQANNLNYGMHITVSGIPVTITQYINMRRFMQTNKKNIQKLVGRHENSYCLYGAYGRGACHLRNEGSCSRGEPAIV